jgi:hypothetical protein
MQSQSHTVLQERRVSVKVKAAFIFVAPQADASIHQAVIETPSVILKIVGVENYEQGAQVAKELAEEGIEAIELCAGFGNEGTSLISKAVAGKAYVGAVKFDVHPGFEFKSGDTLFQ